jgi:hypothetical protein
VRRVNSELISALPVTTRGYGSGDGVPQVPPEQVSPEAHALPQAPQLLTSFWKLVQKVWPASVGQASGIGPEQVSQVPQLHRMLSLAVWLGALAQTSRASTPLMLPVGLIVTLTTAVPKNEPQLKTGDASCDVVELVSVNIPPVVDHSIVAAAATPPSGTAVCTARLAVCGGMISPGMESAEISGQAYAPASIAAPSFEAVDSPPSVKPIALPLSFEPVAPSFETIDPPPSARRDRARCRPSRAVLARTSYSAGRGQNSDAERVLEEVHRQTPAKKTSSGAERRGRW